MASGLAYIEKGVGEQPTGKVILFTDEFIRLAHPNSNPIIVMLYFSALLMSVMRDKPQLNCSALNPKDQLKNENGKFGGLK